MKMYLVTFDGHTVSYGAYIYALGLYASQDDAQAAIDKVLTEQKENMELIQPRYVPNWNDDNEMEEEEIAYAIPFEITELEVGESLPITFDVCYCGFTSKIWFGGYAE